MRTQEAESGGKGSVGTGKQEAGSRKHGGASRNETRGETNK